jgi:AraC family multidrug resistance transcriptional activator
MGLAAIMRSKTLQQSVLSDLLLWIDNNLDKKLTVDDLSDISGYSPWHLFRLFRHYFDRSPMEYIRHVAVLPFIADNAWLPNRRYLYDGRL